MKKIITLIALAVALGVNAQAYKGKGDKKFQVGANIQSGGTGIRVSADFGLGENISYGFTATYLLAADDSYRLENNFFGFPVTVPDAPEFQDRFDAKARFSANLGSVMGLPSAVDVYPGLHVGLRNFGTHLGARYFFSDGFGVFTEAELPIAKYDKNVVGVEAYNNQFVFNIGASFGF
ncbi:DUF6646 family protein [Flavobacterium caeni]|uniref:Outer membrane protein beta-barrel domain-containing protein n=1 Tax=Flavobacterium caeni TaxID=490189 RepID=A0A1G5GVP8_9FLAO|nr:DUF6646 family protein [Flavobacterium caeni]SCY55643.1 hypothetical protein SAMN02927903_01648 [Flavobacterium caeni]